MARTHSRFDVGSGYYGEKTTSKTTNNNNNGNNNNNRERYRTTPRTIDPKVKARNDLAMKIAKQMESKAYWFKWDEKSQTYVNVPEGTENSHRNKGMYVDVKSMRRANAELRSAMDKLGHMMTC